MHLREIFFAFVVIAGAAALGSATFLFATRTPSTSSTNVPFSITRAYLDAVGPVKAQEVALSLSKNPGGFPDGHGFEHGVGAYLFNKYGVSGIQYCKNYYEYGCYHGFMLELPSLQSIKDALSYCSTLQPDDVSGCFHGAGHAALSTLSNYDVPKARAYCGSFAQAYAASSTAQKLTTSCSYGVFMDNSMPGVMEGMTHNILSGAPITVPDVGSPYWADRPSDPAFPCDDAQVAGQYRTGCWEMKAVDLEQTRTMANVASLCDALSDKYQKYYCFTGLADGYTWGSSPATTTADIQQACGAADTVGWQHTCLTIFITTAYVTGISDRIPDALCALVDAGGKETCKDVESAIAKAIAE